MAYMNQERKAKLAPAIKSVLKKYGMKGTIAVRNHSTLVVNIKSGKLNILNNWFNMTTKELAEEHIEYCVNLNTKRNFRFNDRSQYHILEETVEGT